ncbi:MAG: KilA-N domain-containing protein [Alteromonadales bacterium]|nr:KilA-N domain-containing protein [Alteromonadales bacterium]
MKTNQLMTVAFSGGEVEVFHKTAMGNLTQLWSCGNRLRMEGGKSAANLSKFLTSSKTKEFMSVVENSISEPPVHVSGKGNTRKTWANIHMMIYAAEYLSPEFHFEVIDTFVSGKILSYRDESGDNFKAMNIALDNHLPGREGKDNKGLRIQVAKQIKAKVSPEVVSWNFATADDLRYRAEIEDKITSLLSLGVVTGYDHLKTLISKL